MERKAHASALLLTAVLVICLTAGLQVVEGSSQKPRIYVEPPNNQFSTETTPMGSNFTVSIKSAEWTSPGVYGFQIKLYYNNTLLEAIEATFPPDFWLTPTIPVFYFDSPPEPKINQEAGIVSSAFMLLPSEPARTGGGTLSTITFRIIHAPPEGGNVSCSLELRDVKMANPYGELIPSSQYDIVNGDYVYSSPSLSAAEKPRVCVDPEDNVFFAPATAGDTFTVSVKTANWTEPGVFSYQVKLYYNNTLLEAIDAAFPEDAWIKPPHVYTILIDGPLGPIIDQEAGYVASAVTLFNPEPAKTGGGTLFTVTFKIIETPVKEGNISCHLELRNIIMVDPSGHLIPSENYAVQNGEFVFFGSLRVDLNHDGEVNIIDATVWALAFDSHPGDANWNSKVDFNSDGEIDIIDFAHMAIVWTR